MILIMLSQLDSSLVVSLQLEVKFSVFIQIGGLSVAFKNAVMGGVILGLIEGVSVVVTQIAMRR